MGRGKGRKKIVKIFLLLLVLFLAVAAYLGNIYYTSFIASNVDTGGKEVYLNIPRESSEEDVFKLLDDLQVLKDASSFQWLAKKKNYRGKNVVAGRYKIENAWTYNELVNHLRAGNGRIAVSVTFNLVWDLKQLCGAMTKELDLDSTEIYQWLSNPDSIAQLGFDSTSVISMFIPNTYFVEWDIATRELIDRMADEYKKFWNAERLFKLKATGLSQTEVSTLASVVYWETKIPKDMKTIAGVYMNRMEISMPLQADPTLIFAIGDYTIRRVLDEHKEIESPYNTYKYPGLPPGPIIAPPIVYLDAVLDYEEHDYLYFVAKEDFSGESYFSKTYEQHKVYARRYQRELNKQKIFR